MSYITKRFQKAFKRGGAFSISLHTSRSIGPNDLFHECGMPCKFITDYPQPKAEHKDYVGNKGEIGKRKDQVLENQIRQTTKDKVVNKVLATYGGSSNKSVVSEHSENKTMM